MTAPHLLVYLTAHGFGHVAQTAPVLNYLHQHVPNLKLTLCTDVNPALLRARIHAPYQLLPGNGDIGMVMDSALDVSRSGSQAAYQTFHQSWEQRVQHEVATLQTLQADLILSNVAYLPLIAAKQLGIPAFAMCSLNWHHIYRDYCGMDHIAQQILAAYQSAQHFVAPTPSMPMPGFDNLRSIGPIAALGQNRRQQLQQTYGWSVQHKLVLISLGGIQSRLPVENWPTIPNISWLVPENWQVTHPQAIALESLGLCFSDLLASCDLLICKPGYGSYVEASCAGIPVLYVNRPDWPEAPALNQWLAQNNVCAEVDKTRLWAGDIAEQLQQLWQQPQPTPTQASGVAEMGDLLLSQLKLRC